MRARMPSRVAVLFLFLILFLIPGAAAPPPASAQTALTEHTITLDEGVDRSAPHPRASLDDVGWLAGRWVGSGLGATAEETWLPPSGGAMAGVFRLVRDGTVELYEMVLLVEEEGSLTMRLKHFGADFTGWEAKDEAVRFPLVRRDDSTLWFDGLTLERVGPDRMRIWVALGADDGESSEALFEYRRVER